MQVKVPEFLKKLTGFQEELLQKLTSLLLRAVLERDVILLRGSNYLNTSRAQK